MSGTFVLASECGRVGRPAVGERPTAAEAGGGPPRGLARLWAGWRTEYITRVSDDAAELHVDEILR